MSMQDNRQEDEELNDIEKFLYDEELIDYSDKLIGDKKLPDMIEVIKKIYPDLITTMKEQCPNIIKTSHPNLIELIITLDRECQYVYNLIISKYPKFAFECMETQFDMMKDDDIVMNTKN